MTTSSAERTADWLLSVFKGLGRQPSAGARVLEIGCGNGEMVRVLRDRGFDALGCDLRYKNGPHTSDLSGAGLLKLIETNPYRLPFDDASFDIVVSVSVLEHVMNLGETISEMSRITRRGGEGLHMFPSRYRPIEPHTFVPLGTLLRTHWWLRLWAMAGVRNSYQTKMNASDVAAANYQYLHGATNYLTRRRIRQALHRQFETVRFCEELFVAHANGAASNRMGIGKMMEKSRMLTRLYSAARSRIVWVQKGQ